MCGCANVRMRRCADVRMCRCANEKIAAGYRRLQIQIFDPHTSKICTLICHLHIINLHICTLFAGNFEIKKCFLSFDPESQWVKQKE